MIGHFLTIAHFGVGLFVQSKCVGFRNIMTKSRKLAFMTGRYKIKMRRLKYCSVSDFGQLGIFGSKSISEKKFSVSFLHFRTIEPSVF